MKVMPALDNEIESIAEALHFQPLYNYILVRIMDKGEQYAGRIVIPGNAISNAAKHAEVLAVGHGHRMMDGHIEPLKVKPGDHIYFATLAGADIRLGGSTYQITREEEIFGIIRKPEPANQPGHPPTKVH